MNIIWSAIERIFFLFVADGELKHFSLLFWNEINEIFLLSLQGIAHKWHEHIQIYVASFSLLYKYQLKSDQDNNNNTISKELEDILNKARALLCDIEHFVNATSNKDGNDKPKWYKVEEMTKITRKLKNQKPRFNNIFVKARFQHYINRLYKRIQSFNLTKNLEHKSLHNKSRRVTTRGSRKNNRTRRPRTTTEDYTGEPTSTQKVFIVTTRRPRKNTKVGRKGTKKGNRINSSLQ